MTTKRDLLACLRPDELLALAARVGAAVPKQSARVDLIDALTGRRVTLNQILPVLSRARRDDVCRALGIEDRRPEGCVVGE